MTKIVELNIGANQYYGYNTGTGTGSSNHFTATDSEGVPSDTWEPGILADDYQLIDSAGTAFPISANTATVLNVIGTPATGTYKILPLAHLTGFVGGTSLLLDASKIDVDWMNAVLTIQRPVSQSSQKAQYNANNSYTWEPLTRIIVENTTGNFDAALKAGDIMKLNGQDYTLMMSPDGGNQAVINPSPEPPISGTMVCYKTYKEYGINLKKISHNVSIEGWLVNDYVHHPDWTVKLYAEEKAELLYRIVGANAGTVDFANLVFREDSYLRGRYARFVPGDSGDGLGGVNTWTDTDKDWTVDEWTGFELIDKYQIRYPIVSNTDTVLTTTGGTPANGDYTITSAQQGCMACTKMKISDNTKVVAPVRGGGDGVDRDQHVDKLLVSLSFKFINPK